MTPRPPTRRSCRTRAAGATALGAAVLALAGCATTAPRNDASTSSAAASPAATAVPLVVYSAQGYDSAVVAAFQKATGIPTVLDDDSTGPILAKIAAERDNPQWGLVWVDGDEAFAALDQQGQLLDYTPPVGLNSYGRELTPADHSYQPVSFTVMPALVYAAAAVSSPPTSFAQLLAPAYRGAVGMNNPAISGPTFPFVAGLSAQLGGEAAGKAYFRQLKANGLQVYDTNGDTLHALEAGQIKLGLIQSSAAIGAAAKVPGLKVAYLPRATLLPGVIGIDRHVSSTEQAEAERFVDYVLSPAGQAVMQAGDPTGDSLYWPVLPGVTALPLLPAVTTIQTQRIDPYLWGPREGEINTWFENNIVS